MRQRMMMSLTKRFDPASLNPLVWLDATQSNRLFTDPSAGGENAPPDGSIGKWESRIGFRFFNQPTSGMRPIRKAGAMNGKDCVRFDGLDDFLSLSFLGSQAAWTVMVVARTTLGSVSANLRIFTQRGNGDATDYGQAGAWIPSLFSNPTNIGSFAGGINLLTPYPVNTVFDHITTHSGTEAKAYLRGTLIGTIPTTLGNNGDELRLCAPTTVVGVEHFNGDLGDVLIFNYVLSDTQRTDLRTYFKSKWGITP